MDHLISKEGIKWHLCIRPHSACGQCEAGAMQCCLECHLPPVSFLFLLTFRNPVGPSRCQTGSRGPPPPSVHRCSQLQGAGCGQTWGWRISSCSEYRITSAPKPGGWGTLGSPWCPPSHVQMGLQSCSRVPFSLPELASPPHRSFLTPLTRPRALTTPPHHVSLSFLTGQAWYSPKQEYGWGFYPGLKGSPSAL